MAECSAFKYRVFLSCSRRDKGWGRWLGSALANYRIDKDLIGRRTPTAAMAKTLGPVYRDRAGDRPLDEPTLAALRASQYLLVLCSPQAVTDRRVNEQIRCFTALGRADRVIPVIVAGEPGDPARECFPPALRFSLRQDRLLIDRRGEPAAAAARLDRDGRDRVTRKLAAALLCLGLPEIERSARRLRKQRRRLRCGCALAALLALSISWEIGSAWTSHRLSHDAALLERTLERAAVVTTTAVAASHQLGLPRSLSVAITNKAEHQLRALADHGRDTPQLRLRKVAMLLELVQLYGVLGDPESLRVRASEAEHLLLQIAAENSPARNLAASYDRLGDALRAHGLSSEALASDRAGLVWAEHLAADDVLWRHELAVRLVKIGDGELEAGAWEAALASFQRSRFFAKQLTVINSGDPRWRHALQIAHERIGDVARLRGEYGTALESYGESRVLAERLVGGDAANAQWQHLLARSHLKIGDVHRAQNESEQALASYRAAHAIASRLAAADPARQKYFAIAQQRLGLALEARADATSALPEYRAGLAIARRLAAAAPGDAELQFDLASSHARLGMAWEARGELEAAVTEYETAIAIALRHAAGDRSGASWQRGLVAMHARLAGVLHPLGKSGQALTELRRGRDIVAGLLKSAPDFEPWRRQRAYFDSRIAALEGRAQPAIAPVVTLGGPPKL